MPSWTKKKFTGPKKSSGKTVSKRKPRAPLDAKEYVETVKVKKNVFPEALKFRTGLYIILAAEYGDVAKRIPSNPNAETADIDLITLDNTKVNKDDYDFSVPAQVAEYNADEREAKRKKDIVDSREKMHGKILEYVDADVVKRARIKYPDAFDSKFTPTGVFIEYIFSAIFTGDKSDYQKSVRTRLNEFEQLPDVTDEEFIEEGRELLMEAAALDVHQDEKELVTTGMKNLNAQWKALKQEFLLRPTDLKTFDEMEDYLSEKSKLKDVVPDSSLFLEQNTEVSKPKVEKQKGEKFKGKKGGAEKYKGDKPKPGAVVNATPSGSKLCHLCKGEHKLSNCKFLPMCQEVISTVKAKIMKPRSKMQDIIAAAIMSSVESEPAKQEDNFNLEIASYFTPVLLVPEEDAEDIDQQIVADATQEEVEILFDSGAAVNLFSTTFGHAVFDGPPVNILAVGGTARLTKCFNHPIFGLSYYDPNRRVNVVCACKVLTDSEKFRVKVDEDGSFEVMALPRPGFHGAVFKTVWNRSVLMFHHSEIYALNDLPDHY